MVESMSEPTPILTVQVLSSADYVLHLTVRAVSLMMTLASTGNERYVLPDGQTLAESADALSAEAAEAAVSYEQSLAIGCPHCAPRDEHEDCVATEHPAVQLLSKVALASGNIAAACAGKLTQQQVAALPESFGLTPEEVARVFLHDEDMRKFLEEQGATKTSYAYIFLYKHCLKWAKESEL